MNRGFRVAGSELSVRLEDVEVSVLSDLLGQLNTLLDAAGRGEGGFDEAVTRLFPAAYRDDAEAEAEFSGFARADVATEKRTDVETVLSGLHKAGALPVAMGRRIEVRIDRASAIAWMRALANLRVSLEARRESLLRDHEEFAGVEQAEDREWRHDLATQLGGIRDWLSFLQGTLIEAVEELERR